MPYFSNNGIELYYELHGSGPPLMMVAGLASDSRSWQTVVGGLGERFTLILPDNRGVGRSCQECETSIDLIADDCLALIRHLGLEKISLLGHSMGGMAALSFAARYPQLLDKLFLVATAPRNPSRNNIIFKDWANCLLAGMDRAAWFRGIFAWIFTERFFDDPQTVDGAITYLLEDPWPQSPDAFRRQVESISAWDATNILNKITVPTRVIAGDRDILFSKETSTWLASQIPGASLAIIEKAAHSIHSEQPDEFIRIVSTFMDARP